MTWLLFHCWAPKYPAIQNQRSKFLFYKTCDLAQGPHLLKAALFSWFLTWLMMETFQTEFHGTRFVLANYLEYVLHLFFGTFTFFSLAYPRVLPPWRTSNDNFLFSRKVSAEKKKEGDLENSHRSGSENLGYIPEELWNTEQSPSESELVNHRS